MSQVNVREFVAILIDSPPFFISPTALTKV
jgi:hypothetical protein